MDSFFKRLKYYGFGFLLGLIFVVFFFQNRGCSWLPSNRVKNAILDRVLVIPQNEQENLEKNGVSKKDIIAALNDGDVDFNKSRKKGATKVYFIEKELGNAKIKGFYFTLPEESFISEVHLATGPLSAIKNTTKGIGEMIHFPNDENLIFVDSSKVLNCQQEKLGLINSQDILKQMKKSGKIDFTGTNFKQAPKVEHTIVFKDKKGREVAAQAIWYKNKINIHAFETSFPIKCDD